MKEMRNKLISKIQLFLFLLIFPFIFANAKYSCADFHEKGVAMTKTTILKPNCRKEKSGEVCYEDDVYNRDYCEDQRTLIQNYCDENGEASTTKRVPCSENQTCEQGHCR